MDYKLVIAEHADELLDYLVNRLKNEQAAKHLLGGIESIYCRLEENPLQFPSSHDLYLSGKGYREALVPQMDYVVVFSVEKDTVYVAGIFHQMENYEQKL